MEESCDTACKWSRGQAEIYGLFCEFVAPQEENFAYYYQSGNVFRTLEIHVLLSFLLSIFCKKPVINVTLLTLKIAISSIIKRKLFEI